jgi:hypothetical protein
MIILEKETFEKFGYYPKNLSSRALKKVVVVCDGCGNKKNAAYHYALYRGRARRCCSCSATGVAPNDTVVYNMNDHHLLLDLVFRGFLQRGKKRFVRCSKNNKKITVTPEITLGILKFFNMIDNPDMLKLRSRIVEYLIGLSDIEVSNCLTIIFNNHRKLNTLKSGSTYHYYIEDFNGILLSFLDRLGFLYSQSENNSRPHRYKIDYGSFFIDGRWVHIG